MGSTESDSIDLPGVSLKSSTSSTTNTKHGGNRFMKKFFGDKSKATSEVSGKDSTKDTTPEDLQLHKLPPGIITASPFVRPLEHKLIARTEAAAMPRPVAKRRSFETSIRSNDSILQGSGSAFQIAINRERAHRILNNDASSTHEDEGMGSMSAIHSDDYSQEEGASEEVVEDSMESQICQQLDHVARAAAEDPQLTDHWNYYLQCYSKGQFNLNHPPEPPLRNPNFTYLPAVFPSQEEARALAGASYDILWPSWSRDKTMSLLSAALKVFEMSYASISFFDGKYEIFRVESGYNTPRISRSISIAAHALISADGLVVLDTKQDWRFAGNPLVCDEPKIRFFAGAPMLSPDGHSVGVFALYSKEPRAAFDSSQRLELARWSALLLQDLSHQAMYLADADLQSTPLLDRDSDWGSVRGREPAVADDFSLVPTGLLYHKVQTPTVETSRTFADRQLSPSVLSEQTPPSSSGGSEDGAFLGSPKGFGKNHKQLAVNSDLNHLALRSHDDLITPDSEGFIVPTPRPFSSSDLTSLDPHPPNTPILYSQENSYQNYSDMTVENFLSLSDTDCVEQENALVDFATPDKRPRKVKRRNRIPALPSSSRLTGSSFATRLTGRSQESRAISVEIAIECKNQARQLDYDMVYVLKIGPARPNLTDQELFAEGGTHREVLGAHGFEKRIDHDDIFRGKLHIDALRSRGVTTISKAHASPENGKFRVGHLLPLKVNNDTPVRQRTCGLVLGLYKLPRPEQVGMEVQGLTDMETVELKRAAADFMTLLESGGRKSPSIFGSETSSLRRYRTNESRDVEKHILDETPERWVSDEAFEAGRYSSSRDGGRSQSRYPAGEATEVMGQSHGSISFRHQNHPSSQYSGHQSVQASNSSFSTSASRTNPSNAHRWTKSSKASSRKSDKSEKEKQAPVEVAMDSTLDRPFHAINRFRPGF